MTSQELAGDCRSRQPAAPSRNGSRRGRLNALLRRFCHMWGASGGAGTAPLLGMFACDLAFAGAAGRA